MTMKTTLVFLSLARDVPESVLSRSGRKRVIFASRRYVLSCKCLKLSDESIDMSKSMTCLYQCCNNSIPPHSPCLQLYHTIILSRELKDILLKKLLESGKQPW